jgi:hypothetical protein
MRLNQKGKEASTGRRNHATRADAKLRRMYRVVLRGLIIGTMKRGLILALSRRVMRRSVDRCAACQKSNGPTANSRMPVAPRFHHHIVIKVSCDSAALGMCMEFPSQPPCAGRGSFSFASALRWGDTHMSKADSYFAHARHCMDKAAQVQHAEDKRSWLLLAEIWLDMIPEGQRTAADRFDAAVRDHRADLRAVNLRVVQ